MSSNKPRIAIPVPTVLDLDYSRRSWPAYAQAVEASGGEAVEVSLAWTQEEVAKAVSACQGVLLPGAKPDVNPQKYGQERTEECNPDDPARENVDELLLQDAHNLHKPLLGICYGTQGLNVWRTGTLVQHLAPMPVNHRAARGVEIAHSVLIDPGSRLGIVLASGEATAEHNGFLRLGVNSSHHQAIAIPGDGLRVVARCPQDAVIEAVEGTLADHFVIAVQWHPERSYQSSAASRALFTRFIAEARAWVPRPVTESLHSAPAQ